MQELNQKMLVQVYDWLRMRLYTEYNGTSGKTEEIIKKYQSPFLKSLGLLIAHIFIIVIVLGVFSSIFEGKIHDIYIIIFGLSMSSTIIISIRKVKANSKELKNHTDFKPNIPNDRSTELYPYQFTSDGMTLNYYNIPEYISSFKWSEVKYASLESTTRPKHYHSKDDGGGLDRSAMRKHLNNDLKILKEQCPDYPYFKKETLFPDDEVSIEFKLNNHGTVRLPIPTIWYEDDFAYTFVDYIEEQLGTKYIPPAESIDLVEVFFPKLYDRYFDND